MHEMPYKLKKGDIFTILPNIEDSKNIFVKCATVRVNNQTFIVDDLNILDKSNIPNLKKKLRLRSVAFFNLMIGKNYTFTVVPLRFFRLILDALKNEENIYNKSLSIITEDVHGREYLSGVKTKKLQFDSSKIFNGDAKKYKEFLSNKTHSIKDFIHKNNASNPENLETFYKNMKEVGEEHLLSKNFLRKIKIKSLM